MEVGYLPDDFQASADELSDVRQNLPEKRGTFMGYDVPRDVSNYGVDYKYSGKMHRARSVTSQHSPSLVNRLLEFAKEKYPELNGVLVNNYHRPTDRIRPHADDEPELKKEYPIVGIMFGGSRRFIIRPKIKRTSATDKKALKKTVIQTSNRMIIIMGGKCQETHVHEIPPPDVSDSSKTGDDLMERTSFTIRAFNTHDEDDDNENQKNKRLKLDKENKNE